MELNQESSKLLILFAITNLLALALGFIGFMLIGVLAGLAITVVSLILLPIGLEYLYLRKKRNKETT